MDKILITGGAGFIGSHLSEALQGKYDIYILDNFITGKRENIKFIDDDKIFECDITNIRKLEGIIKEHRFDFIIHLAALVSVEKSVNDPILSHEINGSATIKILEIIRKYNTNIKKFIFASSAAVYGNDPLLPKSINMPVSPMTPYALDKYYGERTALNFNLLYGIPTTSLRFFNVYGPKQDANSPYAGVISKIQKSFHQKTDFNIYGDGNQTRDFVYVLDVVQAIQLIINKCNLTNGKVYNVGTGIETTLNDVYEEFTNLYRYKINCSYLEERSGDIRYSYSDINNLLELGYKPEYSIRRGLFEYFSYINNFENTKESTE
ncbi:NAD-dependent dehydratase [Staphylococcus carnosus]|uniref:NAD-dependent epimerase/dehydratase family protein n=1 Tax=Staphylococcus TaxID=1279 RepID=UPI0006ABC817|nr:MULTISPECIES: NAD-dependent epimerase/dehydratase family protein [Staphylococcus]KOR11794.1 NAD-dependent dehydratase [Staphylococcus carnosus]MBU8680705.1 NAD-dependent epimerase/dehydratase family protein [Staphylococcus saprophyticus]MVA84995.1 NAD-dependent epimerase/dehydratase family protein [Staphylococcus saprophyticus]